MWPFGRKNNKTPPSDNDILNTYIQKKGISGGVDYLTRREALCYVPFNRCVSLFAGQGAAMICETLRVVDKQNKLVDTEHSRRAIKLMTESPDGYQPARHWLRELLSDYLIDGNALVAVEFGAYRSGTMSRLPVSLCRLNASTADAEMTKQSEGLGGLVYRGEDYFTQIEMPYPLSKIIHPKFSARYNDSYSTSARMFFGEAPLMHLQRSLRLGITVELYVMDYFDTASKSDLAIEFPSEFDQEAQNLFKKNFRRYNEQGREALLLFGDAKAKSLSHSAQDSDIVECRKYQTQEIARYYGVPAPLIGVDVTSWGSGIEQLARLYWRYGPRLNIYDFLDEFSFRLLPAGQRFEVDAFDEVKGDIAAMTKFIAAVRPTTNTPGLFSRVETREILGKFSEYDNDWEWQAVQNALNLPDAEDEESDEEETDDDQ